MQFRMGPTSTAVTQTDRLLYGKRFDLDQSLVSPNGKYKLVFQRPGTLFLYEDSTTVIWQSRVGQGPRITSMLVDDGSFIIFNHDDDMEPEVRAAIGDQYQLDEKWSTGTYRIGTDRKTTKLALIVENQGNLVIIAEGWDLVWQALKNPRKPELEPRINSLRVGESLVMNHNVYSPNGKYRFIFQNDWNLVVYLMNETGRSVVWAAGTDVWKTKRAMLRSNGEFQIMDEEGQVKWSTRSAGAEAKDAILKMQDDGHVTIYGNGTLYWRSICQKQPGTEKNRLNADEWIAVNQALVSPNDRYRMVLKENGKFVIEDTQSKTPGAIVWDTGVAPPSNKLPGRVFMRTDDDLWVGDKQQLAWSSMTKRRDVNGTAALILGDNGVATIESERLVLWTSNQKTVPLSPGAYEAQQLTLVPQGKNIMQTGQYMNAESKLTSRTGEFVATFSNNGLRVWRKNTTGGLDGVFLLSTIMGTVTRVVLEWTGRLAFYAAKGILYTTDTPSSDGETVLMMQNDGNLIIRRDDVGQWSTGTFFPAASETVDRLKFKEWFSIDHALVSKNGLYTLKLLDNANFSIQKKGGETVFTKSATGVTGAKFMLFNERTDDLEILDKNGTCPDGKSLWRAGNKLRGTTVAETCFLLQDDGNAVLFVASRVAWQSKDNLAPQTGGTNLKVQSTTTVPALGGTNTATSGNGTDRLLPGQTLTTGQTLINKLYTLRMQDDGNLVIYQSSKVIWAANKTAVKDSGRLVLDKDGVISLISRKPTTTQDTTYWTSVKKKDNATGVVLLLMDDGALRVKAGNEIIWSSDSPSQDDGEMLDPRRRQRD